MEGFPTLLRRTTAAFCILLLSCANYAYAKEDNEVEDGSNRHFLTDQNSDVYAGKKLRNWELKKKLSRENEYRIVHHASVRLIKASINQLSFRSNTSEQGYSELTLVEGDGALTLNNYAI